MLSIDDNAQYHTDTSAEFTATTLKIGGQSYAEHVIGLSQRNAASIFAQNTVFFCVIFFTERSYHIAGDVACERNIRFM